MWIFSKDLDDSMAIRDLPVNVTIDCARPLLNARKLLLNARTVLGDIPN